MTYQVFKERMSLNSNYSSYNAKALSNILGLTESEVKDYRKRLKEEKKTYPVFHYEDPYKNVPTEEELAKVDFQLDPRIPTKINGFEISSFKLSKDGVPAETWFKKSETITFNNEEEIIATIQSLKNNPKPYKATTLKSKPYADKCAILLNFTDFHISKLDFTGTSTIETKCQEYVWAVKETITRVKKLYNIEKVFYVLGSDFFHTEGLSNSTTKLTPQDSSTLPHLAFKKGIELITEVIDFLINEIPQIQIVNIPGNHSRGSEYFFGETIKAYYRTYKQIIFDVDFDYRKVITYNNMSAMLHHGDDKPEYIVQQFANYYPKEFTNKEVLVFVGDRHHLKTMELGRVTFRQLGAFCYKDNWTTSKGYYATPRVTTHIFDWEKGRIGEIELKFN